MSSRRSRSRPESVVRGVDLGCRRDSDMGLAARAWPDTDRGVATMWLRSTRASSSALPRHPVETGGPSGPDVSSDCAPPSSVLILELQLHFLFTRGPRLPPRRTLRGRGSTSCRPGYYRHLRPISPVPPDRKWSNLAGAQGARPLGLSSDGGRALPFRKGGRGANLGRFGVLENDAVG